MKKLALFLVACMATLGGAIAQPITTERMLDRFLSYVRIESQSVDDSDPDSFPMTDGQRQIARHIHDEIKSLGKGVEVVLSDDYYIYAKVPSNIK